MPVPASFGQSSGGSSMYGGGGGGGMYGTPEAEPERLPQRTVLATVAKLVYSLNDEQRERGKKWLEDNENQFSDEDLRSYGLERPQNDDRSLLKKVGGGILSGVEQVGNVLGRPGQTSMKALNTVGTAIGGLGLAAQGEVSLGDVGGQFVEDAARTGRAVTDFSGSEDINAREMLNLDRNAGPGGWAGRAIGLADTAGMLAVDPLSWVGASGAGQATKFGLKAFEKGTTGTYDELIRHGAAGLDDAALRSERAIEAGRKMATDAGAGKRGWSHHILGGADKDKYVGPFTQWKQMRAAEAAEKYVPGRMAALKGTTGSERLVQNSVNQALNRGRSGLKFGGETLVGKDTLSKPFVKAGLFGEEVKIPNEALVRTAKVYADLQEEAAQIEADFANIGQADPKTQRRYAKILEAKDAAAETHLKERERYERLNAQAERVTEDNPAFAEALEPYHPEAASGVEQEVNFADNVLNPRNIPADELPQVYRMPTAAGTYVEGRTLDELKLAFKRDQAGAFGRPLTAEELEADFASARQRGHIKAYRTVTGPDLPAIHGTRSTIPGGVHGADKPQFRPPEAIDAHSNMHGPALYASSESGIPRTFAGQAFPPNNVKLGQDRIEQIPDDLVPTYYGVTAPEGSAPPKWISLDETDFPPEIKAFMLDALERARRPGGSAQDTETIDDAIAVLNDPGRSSFAAYDYWKHALERNDYDSSGPIISELNRLGSELGYAGFEYKQGGSINPLTGKADKTRVIFDSDKQRLKELPWPQTHQTNLPTEYNVVLPTGEPFRSTSKETIENTVRREAELAGENPDEVWATVEPTIKATSYHEANKAAREAQAELDPLIKQAAQTGKTIEETTTSQVEQAIIEGQEILSKHTTSPRRVKEARDKVNRLQEDVEKYRLMQRDINVQADQRAAASGRNSVGIPNAQEQAELDLLHDKRVAAMDKVREALDELDAAKADRLEPDRLKAVKAEQQKYIKQRAKLEARDAAKTEKLNARKALNQENLRATEAVLPDLQAYPHQYDRMPIERFGGKLEGARNRVKGFFQRDPGVGDTLGERTAEDFKGAIQKQAGKTQHGGQDILRGFENLLEDARKENMAIEDEIADRLNPALQTEGGVPALIQQYMDEGRPAAARLVQVASEEGERITAERIKLGLLDPEKTHDPETWVKRMFSPEAQRYIDRHMRGHTAGNREKMSSKLTRELSQGGSTEKRGIAPEAATGSKHLEAEARRVLRANGIHIPKDVPIYNDNPILATATSGIELAGQKATIEMVQEMKDLKDNRGVPLISTNKKLAKAFGHQKVTGLPGGEQIYASPEIAKGLHRYDAIMLNDETMQALNRTLRKVNGIWKAQATVPLIGAAFHARNANTNVILNWIAGLENPAWYFKAKTMTGKIDKLMDKLGRETMSFDEILEKADNLTDQEKRWIKGARDHNVLQAQYVGRGLESGESSDTRLRAKSPGKLTKLRDKVNPLNQDKFVGVKTGRKVGRGIENNARMAHFMWAANEFGDESVAAASVKKYLFDYDDLSDTEKAIKDKYIPFYTFMRKNAALMAGQMLENPGKLQRGMMVDELSKNEDAPWLDATPGQGGTLIPGYQVKNNQAPRKLGPASLLGENVVIGMETPWGAAEEAIRPLVETAGELPVTNRFVPDAFKNPEGTAGAARSLLNLPGGPVTEAIRVAAEKAYDTDTFTGGQAKRQGAFDKFADVAGVFMPSVQKLSRMSDSLKIEDAERYGTGKERADRRKALALNAILGLAANAVGPGSNAQERESRYYELNDWIEKQNRGLALDDPRRIPTLDELIARGVPIPQPGGMYGAAR